MAIRMIRQDGDEILKKKSKDVDVIDDKIKELIKDMIDTMHKYDGVGLAAVQVGILKRIVVIDLYEEGKEPYILINPEIIETKGEQEVDEGCLSFPNKYAKIIRPKEVKLRALNEKGEQIEIVGQDLLAQAMCHEVDHLNGVVFVEKIIPGTLEVVTPEDKENRKSKNRKKK
ncbi:MAG: peptide deformylase [Clostridiales bacterium]|nr:peptide deformylase [Clostridiales bacterium]